MSDSDNLGDPFNERTSVHPAAPIEHDAGSLPTLTGMSKSTDSSEAALGWASFHEAKWKRFQSSYRDQYLELYKSTFNVEQHDFEVHDLPASQVGAVNWSSAEKQRLYQALQQKGRHNLPAIAAAVGTKSVTEIRAYLDFVQREEIDRQLFKSQARNILQADIPAAIEIGGECEAALNEAAAALSAFQEHFDIVAGQRTNASWLVDRNIAARLDTQADDLEHPQQVSYQQTARANEDLTTNMTGLFHLGKFIELSDKVFMVGWREDVREDGETPAMTMDAITELHDIVVNLTRRFVQSVMFIAKSRIKVTASAAYSPSHLVKEEDVRAAADILQVESNSWNYWMKLPRRNSLAIYGKPTSRYQREKNILSYDDVEAALRDRGPRRRRSSAASGDSQPSTPASLDVVDSGANHLDVNSNKSTDSVVDDDQEAGAQTEGDSDIESQEDLVDEPDTSSESSIDEEDSSPPHLTRKMRLQILEDEETDYMEQLDQRASRDEEARIFQFLGMDQDKGVKFEDEEASMRRPKVSRKQVDDIQLWSASYRSEWETERETSLVESLPEGSHVAKRRKIDASV